jgi:hypothetical protein
MKRKRETIQDKFRTWIAYKLPGKWLTFQVADRSAAWFSAVRALLLTGLVLSLFVPALSVININSSGIQLAMLIAILAAGWILLDWLWGGRTLHLEIHHVSLVALLLLSLVLLGESPAAPAWSATLSPFNKSIRQLAYLWFGMLTYGVASGLIKTKSDLQWAVRVLVLGGGVGSLYGLLEIATYWTGASWFGEIDHIVRNNPSFAIAVTERLFHFLPRIHATAPEPSVGSILFILPLILAGACGLAETQPAARSKYLGLAIGMGALYFFFFSRLGIVMLVTAGGVIFLLSLSSATLIRVRLTAFTLLLVGILSAGWMLSSTGRGQGTPLGFTDDSSIYTRVVTQKIALDVLVQHPQGIGWGLFGYYFSTQVDPFLIPNAVELQRMAQANPRGWVPIHNTYLRIAVELGLAGLGLFAFFLGAIGLKLWRTVQATRGTPQRALVVGVFAAFIAVLVGGLMADLSALLMFWFLLAFAKRVADLVLVTT